MILQADRDDEQEVLSVLLKLAKVMQQGQNEKERFSKYLATQLTIKRRGLLASFDNPDLEELPDEEKHQEELVNKYLAEKSPTKTLGSNSEYRKSARLDGWILFLLMAYKLPSKDLVDKALDDLDMKTNLLGDYLMEEFQKFCETV